VFVENSPMLTSRGLGRVLGDLASMGFDARWGVLGAADIGANHQRDRIWIVANSKRKGLERWPNSGKQKVAWAGSGGALADTSFGRYKPSKSKICTGWDSFKHKSWWAIEPDVGRVANGVAARVDRLKAIGNGQVPLCAATAWRILNEPT